MSLIFVGIGVSKDRLDVAWEPPVGPAKSFANDPSGIAARRELLERQS